MSATVSTSMTMADTQTFSYPQDTVDVPGAQDDDVLYTLDLAPSGSA